MPDIREALETALAEPEAVETTPATEAPTEPAAAPAAQPRDEAGRYAAKTQEAPDPAPRPDSSAEAAPPPPVASQDLPPRSLKGAIKERWGALDPDVKAELWRRERDAINGINTYKARAEVGDRWTAVVQPYEAEIRQAGATPEQAVSELFKTHKMLMTADPQTKLQKFHQLARQYGVDLSQRPQPIDENYRSLQNEIQSLKSERQRELEERQRAIEARLTSEIDAFAESHEHFEDVRGPMTALLQSGEAHDLETAYEMAVWARPDLRASMLEQQRAEADKKARDAAAAAKAKAASVSVKGSSPANASAGPPKTIRAAIEAAMSQT